MFIFRFIYKVIKSLIFLVGLGTIAWWGYQYMQPESPFRKKVEEFKQSGVVQEGMKDMKTWSGEIYKSAGGKLQDTITDSEKKKLDEIFEKELSGKKQETGGRK